MYKHREIAEKVLGKKIDPKHPVHHVDYNVRNNQNNNLVVCQDDAYHKLLHKRSNKIRGNIIKRKKSTIINIHLPEQYIRMIEDFQKQNGLPRAEIIRQAIREYIQNNRLPLAHRGAVVWGQYKASRGGVGVPNQRKGVMRYQQSNQSDSNI